MQPRTDREDDTEREILMLKKIIPGILIAVCCALLVSMQANAVMLGDVDGNGRLTAADARLTLRGAVGLERYLPGSQEFAAADTNGNGKLEAADARKVLRGAVALDILPADAAEVLADDALADPRKDWSAYDALIAQIRSERDPAKRESLMHEAEDMLMSGYCVLPLYYYNDTYLENPAVTGIYASPYGTKYFQYALKADGSKPLNIQLAGEPYTLDPALNTSVDGACLAAAAFSGLYTYNAEGRLVPDCAASYTVSDDGLTYTVTLKPGLKWSDGSPLTASDFAYAWKRAASPAFEEGFSYMFAVFDGYPDGEINVTAVDDATLRFVLAAPCAYMEDLLAFPAFFPVKESEVTASPDGWCGKAGFVCNGPFVLSEWKHYATLTYTKNPYYHNAATVKTETLAFLLEEDENAVYAAYQAGKLDFADAVSEAAFGAFFSSHAQDLHVVSLLGTYYISFRANSPLFADKTAAQAACMREAISLLIDREKICMRTGGGNTQPAGTFIPLGMSGGNGTRFHADADNLYFDPYAVSKDAQKTRDRARCLLAAAGYRFDDAGKLSAETPLEIRYLTNGGGNVTVAELIKEDLAAIGVKLTVEEVTWTEFLAEQKSGNFDVVRGGWIADFNDPINMLEMWITDSGNNTCGFGR